MKAHPKKPLLAAAFLAAIATFAGGDFGSPALAQTAAPPAAMPAGLSGATIRALQEALNKQGIVVKIDGVLDEETRAAIRRYQSQHHLPVTGEPDKATLNKLGVAARQGAAPDGLPVRTVAQRRTHGEVTRAGESVDHVVVRSETFP